MSEVPPAVSPARTPEEVRRALAEQIGSGRLRPGQRLGAERALAAEFGVSRATLRQAPWQPNFEEAVSTEVARQAWSLGQGWFSG